MNVILVDDEQLMLDEMTYYLSQYPDIKIVGEFTNALKVIEYAERLHKEDSLIPDAIFMDIDMSGINGLDAALKIQEVFPDIIIVFVTAYSSYALDSFKVHPLDYVLKPVEKSHIDAAVSRIRRQVQLLRDEYRKKQKYIYITCFGHFGIFVSGERADIKWGTHRVKELFMYLIDKCWAAAGRSELINEIFGGNDDKKTANNLYVTMHKLRNIITGLDPDGLFIRLNEGFSLKVEPGVCDYIDFMSFARGNGIINSQNADKAAKALKLCKSGYLEGFVSQWAIQTSNDVEIEYERISISLATFYASIGRSEAAEKVLSELILRNPLSDAAYTILLDQYMKYGKKDEFIIIFSQYVQMLKSNLGQRPPKRYILHYKHISNV